MSGSRSVRQQHEDWLNLLERSGPFLTVPVLIRTWAAGLEPVPREVLDAVRPRFADWREDPVGRQREWIGCVLGGLLDWGDRLVEGPDVPEGLEVAVPEYSLRLRPDFGLQSDEDTHLLLGTVHPPGTSLTARVAGERWTASPVDRLALLLRGNDVPLGLTTDGRWWALVWAPREGATGVAVWDGGIWLEERDSLAAFRCLLERQRFLGVPPEETLPSLLEAGLDAQEEITEGLGRQVREAVEMIVQAIGRAAAPGGRAERLLVDVPAHEIYHGAVTVMMRLVFLLFAEERRLLPADDDLYLRSYSAGQLVDELREAANAAGEDTLEHRISAWHRLLSLFRAIHRGVGHDRLSIPAYGGIIFDPDRHPWLEGRSDPAEPAAGTQVLPIDDRTVLHALEAIQFVRIGGERRRLTFRTLDVEQIGYVYEGLLGYDAWRADEPVVALVGRAGEEPEVRVDELEARGADVAWLREITGWSERRLKRETAAGWAEGLEAERRVRAACGGDDALVMRLLPFAWLLRRDLRGLPIVIPSGGVYVTESPRRRLSGTHYTPRDLAERVVVGALEPLVHSPGPLETADRSKWTLRPSREILALKVADIAMGSGAFLVAACRYLAGKVVQAWTEEGNPLARRPVPDAPTQEVDPEADPVVIEARRRVIEHCLYGGDVNEMAVEMAKLSLWLVSLSRERPFSFLDDRLACGDSLLGLTSLDQLRSLHLDPQRARRQAGELGYDLWGVVRSTLDEVQAIRRELSEHPLRDLRDAEYKARLLGRAQEASWPLNVIADAMVGVALAYGKAADDELLRVAGQAAEALRWADPTAIGQRFDTIAMAAAERLETGRPEGAFDRTPTHWPLVFPEVFEAGGFDAIVGNPPFLGGQKLTGAFGVPYREFLVRWVGRGARGSADLLAYFVLVAHAILNERGQTGLIATKTLSQGATREVGLDQLTADGVNIRAAVKSAKWPTRTVNLEYAVLWSSRQEPDEQAERKLDGRQVRAITSSLDEGGRVIGKPFKLRANEGIAFIASYVLGLGFTMTPDEARELIDREPQNSDVLFPYINGEDLNGRPDCSPSRWVINFRDWSLEQADNYPACIDRVRRLVKPERDRLMGRNATGDDRARHWWRYGRRADGLYSTIKSLNRVVAIAQNSRTLQPVILASDMVFDQTIIVFGRDSSALFSLLSSALHTAWTMHRGITLRTDQRYTPSHVFETLPLPDMTGRMAAAGETLDTFRRPLMLERQLGLTALYNLVHDPTVRDPDIQRIRDIHVEIDRATAEAYGWSDVPLDHGFHQTRQGMRFTVCEAARVELLDRLLGLNHQRHAKEEELGITTKRGRRAAKEIQQTMRLGS